MKKIFALIVMSVCFATTFAQSSTEVITHKIPLGEKCYWPKNSDWAMLYYTTEYNWVVVYNNVWVTLSKDGKSVTITEKKPEFEILDTDESLSWNYAFEKQSKKFKYSFTEDKDQSYLVITVRK